MQSGKRKPDPNTNIVHRPRFACTKGRNRIVQSFFFFLSRCQKTKAALIACVDCQMNLNETKRKKKEKERPEVRNMHNRLCTQTLWFVIRYLREETQSLNRTTLFFHFRLQLQKWFAIRTENTHLNVNRGAHQQNETSSNFGAVSMQVNEGEKKNAMG